MRSIDVLPIVHRNFLTRTSAAGLTCLVGLLLTLASPPPARAETKTGKMKRAERPGIVIRPANFDPADELAYTRKHGQLDPGMTDNGPVWNQPPVYGVTVPCRACGGAAYASVASIDAAADRTEDRADEQPPAASAPPVRQMTYAEAYAQVPFMRSEYEANPGYRHQAAMEIMFGQMRPSVTTHTNKPYFSRYPDFFRYRHAVYPYR
jgi:hypothetical protein